MKRRYIIMILALLITAALIPSWTLFADGEDDPPVTGEEEEQPEPDINEHAKYISLYCIDTDTVLYEKSAHEKCPCSSSAKLMTALIASEKYPDFSATIELAAEAMTTDAGTLYGFHAGDTVTVYDLLCALLIRNSNEAAEALAAAISGSSKAFAELMNSRAGELGMTDTLYSDATGVSAYSSTTAADISLLTRAFAQNDELLAISGSPYKKLPSTGVTVYSRNFYLSSYYNGGKSYINREVTGGITGQTSSSGDTLISVSKHGSYSYICVVTGAKRSEEDIYSYLIANSLVEWGSVSFRYTTLINDFDVICNIAVNMGKSADEAAVFPAKSVVRYLPVDTNVEEAVSYTYELDVESLTAPVSFGDKVGTLTLYLNGEKIAGIDLIIRSDIQMSSYDYLKARVYGFMAAPTFIRAAVLILAAGVIYVIAVAFYRGRIKRKRKAQAAKDSGGGQS